MELLKRFWTNLKTLDERQIPKLLLVLFAALVALSLLDVMSSWVRRHTAENEAAVVSQMEELRKLEFAKERDRLAIERERRQLDRDAPTTQALKELGEIFIRIGPYALLFFSIAQAWKVFEDQRTSRLRLALALSFSVIVVGFVLVVGGYVSPTDLKMGLGNQQTQIASESLGMVVIAIGAAMATFSFVAFRPKQKKDKGERDEA